MAKKLRATAIGRFTGVRPGEGHTVEVTRTPRIGTDGKTTALLGVNLATAPVPERKYVADAFQVIVKDRSVRILFGQQRLNGGLRSLLVIHMGGDAVTHFVESLPTGEEGKPTFKQIASNLGISSAPPMEVTSEPEQTVALKANAVYAAFSSHDACMDFYQISPAAIHASRNANVIGADAVVRVDMRTSEMLGLCDALEELEAERKQDAPSESTP